MINGKVNEFFTEIFDSLISRYQIGLETSMKVSILLFDYVHLLYCKCHKKMLNKTDHI